MITLENLKISESDIKRTAIVHEGPTMDSWAIYGSEENLEQILKLALLGHGYLTKVLSKIGKPKRKWKRTAK